MDNRRIARELVRLAMEGSRIRHDDVDSILGGSIDVRKTAGDLSKCAESLVMQVNCPLKDSMEMQQTVGSMVSMIGILEGLVQRMKSSASRISADSRR